MSSKNPLTNASLAAAVLFAAVAGMLSVLAITSDRAASLHAAEERTQSMARLIMAHGDAAIEDADNVITAIEPLVEQWDLKDPAAGRHIFDELRKLLPMPRTASAWIVDGQGIDRLDTWAFPAKPISGLDRPYMQAHLAGAPDPVLLGDDRPGSVTGKQRFTFSKAVRNPDGSLRAVIVVAIYDNVFAKLYQEAANWPGARVGLHVEGAPLNASVLAHWSATGPSSADLSRKLNEAMTEGPKGTLQVSDETSTRIVSWQRSEQFRRLYSTASEPIDAALRQWRWRSAMLALSTLVGLAGFSGVIFFGVRAQRARESEHFKDILAREIHHRVKNSLQIVAGMLSTAANRSSNPDLKAALDDSARRVSAIASVHDMLQASRDAENMEFGDLVQELCRRTRECTDRKIVCEANCRVSVDSSRAVNLAIIVNELVTNGVKHAREVVAVRCSSSTSSLVLEISDDGPGLPDNFEPSGTGRFGLVTAARLCKRLGGSLTWNKGKGAEFVVRIPLRRSSTLP